MDVQISQVASVYSITSNRILKQAEQNLRLVTSAPSASFTVHALSTFALHSACEKSRFQFDIKTAHVKTGLKPLAYQKEFIRFKLFVDQNSENVYDWEDELKALCSRYGCMMMLNDAIKLLERIQEDGYRIDPSLISSVFYILTEIAAIKMPLKMLNGPTPLVKMIEKLKRKYGDTLKEFEDKHQRLKMQSGAKTNLKRVEVVKPREVNVASPARMITNVSSDAFVEINMNPGVAAPAVKKAKVEQVVKEVSGGDRPMVNRGDVKSSSRYKKYAIWLEITQQKLIDLE